MVENTSRDFNFSFANSFSNAVIYKTRKIRGRERDGGKRRAREQRDEEERQRKETRKRERWREEKSEGAERRDVAIKTLLSLVNNY